MTAPLDGLRVLDFSRVLSGPYATMFLADMGADVVKVEHPGRGDDTRAYGPPFVDGVSTYFLSINRGKRSVALDLKQEGDRAQARKLALAADVVVENFRPGVMDRLGLGCAALRAANPRLVWCSISGFGQSAGPRAGYDLVVQGLSGIPAVTGEYDGAPTKCGASIADMVAGLNAVQGILAALYRRERTGEGGFVDVSMLDGQLALLTYHASAWLNAQVEPERRGNAHPSIHPFRSFKTADGYVNLAIGNDALWRRFCDELERLGASEGAALKADHDFATNAERVQRRGSLSAILEPVFERFATASWLEVLGRAGVPCGPMATVPEALEQAHLAEHAHPSGGPTVRTVALPFQIDGGARASARRAPRLGEHTREVLAEWGNRD